MKMMKLSVSNKSGLHYVVSVVLILLCISLASSAQPQADLDRLQAKYPGAFFITESVTNDLTFEITKSGIPKLSCTDYSSIFVLGDNATVLSESKEYFSTRFEVKELNAYSLVPDQNSYKKQSVTNFTKTRETGDGVFFDDLYAYIFNFPSVSKGTKLVTISKTVNSDLFYPIVFYFGAYTPIDQARLTLTFPEYVDISYHMFGYDTATITFSKTNKGKNVIYEWTGGNAKSYIADDQSPSARYFTPHIIVNIAGYTYKGKYTRVLGNLKDLYGWDYSKISHLNSTLSPEIRLLADSITASLSSDREKVKHIYRWVQQNIKYVAIEDGDNGHVPREAALVLQRRYGDCKDKSSLLTAMIHAVGLKSSLAWVGTRTLPYKYSEFPAVLNSNHMIAIWWDEQSKPVILDGTTLFHNLGEIPSTIQGKQCIIEKGPDDFQLYQIPLSLPAENVTTDTVWVNIKNGLLNGKGTSSFTGEFMSNTLARFEGVDSTKYNMVLNKLIPKASNKCKYTSAKVSDRHNLDQPATVNYDFELPDYITSNNGSSYINMNLERYLNDVQLKADRWIPIETETPFMHRFVCILQIPGNTTVGSLPEASSYKQPGFSFSQQYSREGNTIILTTEITADGRIIEGPDIGRFREMLLELNKAYKKSIVLTKI